MEVTFTLLAQRTLEKLHDDITADANEKRADGYITRIVDFCEGFSTFPHRGTRRDDVWTGLRVTGFERRVTIAFIVTEDAVLIEGVFFSVWKQRSVGAREVTRAHDSRGAAAQGRRL